MLEEERYRLRKPDLLQYKMFHSAKSAHGSVHERIRGSLLV